MKIESVTTAVEFEFDPGELTLKGQYGRKSPFRLIFLKVLYPHDREEAIMWQAYGAWLRKDGKPLARPAGWEWSWNFDNDTLRRVGEIVKENDPR